MVRICILVPSYVGLEDIERTRNCICSKLLGQDRCKTYLYFEEDILENIALSGEEVYCRKTLEDFECALSEWDPDDVVIPLFAGDHFQEATLASMLEAIDEAEYTTVFGTTGANINLIRVHALDLGMFLTLLKHSCLMLADCFADCVSNVVCREVFVDEPVNSLCWDVHKLIFPKEKRKVWAFCAGHYSNDFRGNPKYLFLYLNRYRSDIKAYWLCDNESIIAQVRRMGYPAFRLGTALAEFAIDHTGVLVAEQVKNAIPAGLEDAVYLNLWHGVGGIKAVERSLVEGRLAMEIAKKYIQHNTYYRTNEMYLAPSVFIEGIAREQLALQEHQIVRSGYPRNIYQHMYEPVATFSHNCFRHKELPDDTRFAAYIPTYRNVPKGDLFATATPDMERLIEACRQNHICMIFKMHPLLENELSFKQAKVAYADCPWVYFWDNSNDFYEVLDQMDLCIFDYSSMFTDFIAAGCRHFLRYAFDFTGSDLNFPLDYDEATLGRKCTSFEEFLQALETYRQDDLSTDLQRISDLYWEHSGNDSMDRIVQAVLDFRPVKPTLPTLYSFDIFDTLISRRVLAPEGIFYRVQERMRESGICFPKYLVNRYPFIRRNAELNMREYYNRSKVERNDERCEIQFSEIMKRIQTLYGLTDKQTSLLYQWEIEAELDDVLPLKKNIARVKQLLADGETVILISDMYLPGDVIRKMLRKADPVLANLPLYLSSERGYQKSAKNLYMEVYRDFAPDYGFDRWIHTGDNLNSDVKNPRSLNIETIPAHRIDFNRYEAALAKALQSYDGYLIAASMARFREEHPSMQDQFAYAYVSLLFVPYVHWAMHSCKALGKKNVYLIARDGHQLKRIADVINEAEQLELNTKYIYASRRVWRIPSFFDHIDVGFWGQGYGNMAKVNKFSKLLKALDMDEPTFRQMFPELQALNEDTEISSDEIVRLADIFKNSDKYRHYLLARAEEQRFATCEYMKQEMDLNTPFAVIEYWGRGYTQENFTRLWQYVCGRKEPTTFYYSRSTLPSDQDNIRMNFTSHPSSQAFIESIFACINYKTIQSYQRIDSKWMPVTEEIVCNQDLFCAMEKYLPQFASVFCTLPMTDRETTGRNLIDFAITWYAEHPEWEGFTKVLSQLVDSVEMYGAKTQFANPLTMDDLDAIAKGKTRGQISKNISISYHRSEKDVQQRYRDMFQIREGESLTSGWKLSDQDMQRNLLAAQELSDRKRVQSYLQKVYNESAQQHPVEQKILLVSRKGKLECLSLLNALNSQAAYSVEVIYLNKCCLSDEDIIRKFASARFILSFSPLTQLSSIKLRTETELIILGNSPIQLFYTGLLRKNALRNVKDLHVFNLTNDISVIHTPSAVAAERARNIYSIGTQTRILQTGNVITDCYFNKEMRNSLRENLIKICPEAEGKKIIAYLPWHRYRNAKSRYAYLMDMHQMQKELGNDYFVAMHLMDSAKEITNNTEIPGFSRNLANVCSIRALMLTADVIVADYRDTTFEAPLVGVPIFVTCGDKRQISKRDDCFTTCDEMMFGVPVNNTDELIAQLKDLDSYDHTNRIRFIANYLTFCDGHSADRLVSSLLEEKKTGLLLPDLGPIGQTVPEVIPKAPIVKVCKDLDSVTAVLHWAPVPGAEAYEILASELPDGLYRKVGKSKFDSCVHRVYNKGKTALWYRIRALYQGGSVLGPCSEAQQVANIADSKLYTEAEIQKLPVPQILFILPSAKGNRLYWNGDSDCAGWRVYCYYADGSMEILDHLQVNTWEWTDRDPRADQKTVYELSTLYWAADGQLIEGKVSAAQTVSKVKKSELAPAKFLLDRFVLKWKPIPGAKAYHIYRRIGVRAMYVHIEDMGSEKLEYTERTNLSGSVSYILQAETAKGMITCRPVTVQEPPALPKPTGLRVEKTAKGNMLLWNSGVDVDWWNIRLCTADHENGKKIAEVAGNQVWWFDTEQHTGQVSYCIEAVRKIGDANQFSGYCKGIFQCSPQITPVVK